MTSLRTVIVGAAIVASATSSACLWDRDTLADQNKNFPGFFEATVGWFEKNPDLYYSMRAARIEKKAKTQELTLEEYDDVAVSLDRLGKSDQAIAWIEKKKVKVDGMGDAAKEHLYRYHSNLATFQIHKWLAKPDRKNPKLVSDSIMNLEKAIEINPSAHFGREAVQLNLTKLIEFDLKEKPAPGGFDKAYFDKVKAITDDLNKQQNGPTLTEQQRKAKAIEGITGLIILGYGYSLTDMYLLATSQFFNNGKLRFLSELRMSELASEGVKHVFSPELVSHFPNIGYLALPDDKVRMIKLYTDLRAKAKAHDTYRRNFMMKKLRKGQHPDTHKSFWKGYKPLKPLDVKIDEPNAFGSQKAPI